MNLPDKPSELIRLALADLALCADDPNYAASRAAELYSSDFQENHQKIKALDDFRQGLAGYALDALGHDLSGFDPFQFDREIAPYRADPGAFMADMRQLADDLEAAGY